MQRFILFTLILISPLVTIKAQDFSVGFKAGLNFSSINGPSEVNASGTELEDFTLTTGFTFGARFNVGLTDIFGVRAELVFSQKGTEYVYDGDSFWRFPADNGESVLITGNRRTVLRVVNGYLELPLMAYARFDRVELSGGLSIATLLSSRGTGEIIVSGETSGQPVSPISLILDYDFSDDPLTPTSSEEGALQDIAGVDVTIPESIGAYYEASGNDAKAFNSIDIGLNAEVAFYLNKGLYIGLRGTYGLIDVTDNDQDFSKLAETSENVVELRNDVDRNVSLLASLGFSF